MRGGLATTTRYRANCGGFSLIRPRAGPRPPSSKGEGFYLLLRLIPIPQRVEQFLNTVAQGVEEEDTIKIGEYEFDYLY